MERSENSQKDVEIIDPVVEEVCRKMRERSRYGLRKYENTLAREDFSVIDWLRHAQEEAMDLANYLECVINRFERKKRETRGES
jgi:hypothetical protein